MPHVVVPGPGPVRARLLFRVGAVDEEAHRRGLTHLVEHLVMRAVGRRPFEVGAHVDAWTTAFEATGTAADVTAFVEDVWAVLADLPTEAAELEKAVLRLEGDGACGSPAVDSVYHRYGLTGPGRLWSGQLGLTPATGADLRAWVGERFVRPAAALAATADIRPDLSGGVPTGRRRPLPVAVPAWPHIAPVSVGDSGGTAVSLLLPTAAGHDLAVGRLLRAVAERVVRHERALAYEVGMDVVPVSASLTEVAVYAGCDPERAAEVAGLLVAAARSLRDAGPVEADLAFERQATTSAWQVTPDHLEVAAEWALALLVDQEPRTLPDRLREVRELSADAVRDVLAGAWPSLQVLVPGAEDPGIDGVQPCRHHDEPLPGRRHHGNPFAVLLPGARIPASPFTSVASGEEGLTLVCRGEVSSVRWADVAAVVEEAHGLVVVGVRGPAVRLPDGSFTGWRRLRRSVHEHVDASRFVPALG